MENRPIYTTFLDESPAFLQFLRNETNKNDLVVSTYQLSKESLNLRTGCIYILSSFDWSIKRRIETNGGVFRFEVLQYTVILFSNCFIFRLFLAQKKC